MMMIIVYQPRRGPCPSIRLQVCTLQNKSMNLMKWERDQCRPNLECCAGTHPKRRPWCKSIHRYKSLCPREDSNFRRLGATLHYSLPQRDDWQGGHVCSCSQGGAAKKKIGHGVEIFFRDQVGRTN